LTYCELCLDWNVVDKNSVRIFGLDGDIVYSVLVEIHLALTLIKILWTQLLVGSSNQLEHYLF